MWYLYIYIYFKDLQKWYILESHPRLSTSLLTCHPLGLLISGISSCLTYFSFWTPILNPYFKNHPIISFFFLDTQSLAQFPVEGDQQRPHRALARVLDHGTLQVEPAVAHKNDLATGFLPPPKEAVCLMKPFPGRYPKACSSPETPSQGSDR